MVAADLRPRGPYSLALSARGGSDATRTFRDGILNAALPGGRAVAWQRPDGIVCLRATGEEALERMRFCLGMDDDHTPFVLRFRRDPMIGSTVQRMRGLRPIRLATVAQLCSSRPLRPADPRQRGARDGAADHPGDDRTP